MTEDRRRDYRRMTDDGVHPDVAALHLSVQAVEDRLTETRAAIEELAHQSSPDVMRGVIVSALREAAEDQVITKVFFANLRRAMAQYIGERFMASIVALMLAAVIGWWAWTNGARSK